MGSRWRGVAAPVVVFALVGVGTVDVTIAQVGHLPGATGTVWVTNRAPDFNNVTAFDAANGRVLATVPVGANPIGVVAPIGTGKVYVSNEDANSV